MLIILLCGNRFVCFWSLCIFLMCLNAFAFGNTPFQRGGWIYPAYPQVFDPFQTFNSGLSYINIGSGLSLQADGSVISTIPQKQFEVLVLYKKYNPSFQVFIAPGFNETTIETILSSPSLTTTAANNLAQFVVDNSPAVNGIIFDWEPGSAIPPPLIQEGFVSLCSQLSNAITGIYIPVRAFFDQGIPYQQFDITGLASVLDAFELQSYQLTFPGSGLQSMLEKWFAFGVHPSQLLLGIGISSEKYSNVWQGSNPIQPGDSFIFHDCSQAGTLNWMQMTEILQTNPNAQLIQNEQVVDYVWVPSGPCICMAVQPSGSTCGCGNPVNPCDCNSSLVCGASFFYNTIQELYIFSYLVRFNNLRGVFVFTYDQDVPNNFVTQTLTSWLSPSNLTK